MILGRLLVILFEEQLLEKRQAKGAGIGEWVKRKVGK
jgi:hypothetical protein